ncbi:succinate dehydrogenase assembly factor 2 [Palleronia sp. THAF1]|uniref:succinate dehydrogenase assembly factor 2 n=1 Tax=Palleronia sp. THAF1 TaxID=2587842 RepID=UPI0039B8D2B7
MRRGIKEMDLILSTFADERLGDMDAEALHHYETMLSENDQLLYRWVSGQEDAPDDYAALIADIAAVTKDRSIRLRTGRI